MPQEVRKVVESPEEKVSKERKSEYEQSVTFNMVFLIVTIFICWKRSRIVVRIGVGEESTSLRSFPCLRFCGSNPSENLVDKNLRILTE